MASPSVASIVARLPGLNASGLVRLLAVLLEVLWAYPCLVWVSGWENVGWQEAPMGLGSAVGLVLVSQVAARAVLGSPWSLGRARLAAVCVVLVLLGLILRLELGGGHGLGDPGWGAYAQDNLSPLLGGAAFGAYLIWRGFSVGRDSSMAFDDLYQRFAVGLGALVVLLVLWAATQGSTHFPSLGASTGLYVAAYFLTGTLSLALANLVSARQQVTGAAEGAGRLDGRSVALILGTVVVMVLVALGVASAFSFDLADTLVRPLKHAADGLLIAFMYGVVLPVGAVAVGIIYALRFLGHLVGISRAPQEFQPPDVSELLGSSEQESSGGIAPEAVLAIKWVVVAVVVLVVLYLLFRALFRRPRQEEGVEEESESLWSWDAFSGDLASLLSGLLGRLRRPAGRGPPVPPVAVVLAGDPGRMFTVREMYQGLLWQGWKAGIPRRRPETPSEYCDRLERRAGVQGPDAGAITEAYMDERYGHTSVDPNELARLNGLWRRLWQALSGQDED